MADKLFGNIRHDGSTWVEPRDSSIAPERHYPCSWDIFRKGLHWPIVFCIEVGPCVVRVAREPVDRDDTDTLESWLAFVRADLFDKSGAIALQWMKHGESTRKDRRVLLQPTSTYPSLDDLLKWMV